MRIVAAEYHARASEHALGRLEWPVDPFTGHFLASSGIRPRTNAPFRPLTDPHSIPIAGPSPELVMSSAGTVVAATSVTPDNSSSASRWKRLGARSEHHHEALDLRKDHDPRRWQCEIRIDNYPQLKAPLTILRPPRLAEMLQRTQGRPGINEEKLFNQ